MKLVKLPPPVPPAEYQLTLTHDEAVTLRTIFNRIGGPPGTSRRRHVEDMNNALSDAGVTVDGASVSQTEAHVNCIYFR
jgi:hypothetical protein